MSRFNLAQWTQLWQQQEMFKNVEEKVGFEKNFGQFLGV